MTTTSQRLAEAEEWAALCRKTHDADPTPEHRQLWTDALADLRRLREQITAAYAQPAA